MNRADYIKNTINNIDKYGRNVIGCFDNEIDEDQYTYFYSIGNSKRTNQPRQYKNWRSFEYILFHPTDVSAEIIHKVAYRVSRHKHNLNLGVSDLVKVPGLLTDFHIDGFYLPPEQLVGLMPLRGLQEQIVKERYMKAYQWGELKDYWVPHKLVVILLSDENNRFVLDDDCNPDFREWTPELLWNRT